VEVGEGVKWLGELLLLCFEGREGSECEASEGSNLLRLFGRELRLVDRWLRLIAGLSGQPVEDCLAPFVGVGVVF